MIEKKHATWADIKANGRSAEELARLDAKVEREAETIRRADSLPSLTSSDGRVTIMAPESMTLGEVTQALLSIPAFGAVLTMKHDDRGFVNPPDMGKLRPADEVAKEMVTEPYPWETPGYTDWAADIGADDDKATVYFMSKDDAFYTCDHIRNHVAAAIRQGRDDGAAEAMRAVGEVAGALDSWATEQEGKAEDSYPHEGTSSLYQGKAEAFRTAAATLRSLHPASARGFIEPPDMGRPNALSETTSEIRGRVALPPASARGFIRPPDLGKPGDVGFIEPPDMGRGK